MKPEILIKQILLPAIFFIGLSGIGEIVHAQLTDTTSVDLGLRGAPRIQKTDARSVALAGSTVADIYQNSSMNANPALIAFVKGINSVEFHNYKNWNTSLVQQTVTLPALRVDNHTIALQSTFMYDGGNMGNLAGSRSLPKPDLQVFEAGLAYAYRFENNISVGILNTTSFARSSLSKVWTNYTDIGMVYAPEYNITYGLALRGLGTSVMYEFDTAGNTILKSQNVRQVLELGATLKIPVESDAPFMALSFSNEKQFGNKGIWYKGGLEIFPVPMLALRTGMLFEPDEKIFAPRYGLGLNLGFLKADYSISPKQLQAERFHQISLTIHF